MIFVNKNPEKGVYLSQDHGADMARGQADLVRGPARGCDEALRPRGRTARGPREVQVARTRGKRPGGSTRTPVWGATWQGGWHVKGPRASGPW